MDVLASVTRFIVALVVSFVVVGCTTVVPIDLEERSIEAQRSLMTSIQTQEPLLDDLTLYDAMARALKYNLDAKIELEDEMFRRRQNEAMRTGMWPAVVASFTTNSRSNDAGSSSRSLLSNRESLEPSTSTERDYYTADLTASWNLLDFGLAYAQSHQGNTEESIAQERRRKVINRVLESVRTAYWRAVSAERTYTKLLELESLAQRALYQASQLENSRRVPLLTTLEYQRDLLKVQKSVQELQRKLMLAKYQLAALINLPPSADFKLQVPNRTDRVPGLPASARQMIRYGLYYRPELRELFYEQEINKFKLDAAFYESLPGVEFILGGNYTSNEYLYNDSWLSFSSQISWNLISMFRYPLRKKVLEAEADVLFARQQAMVMAIITQIHVSRARYIRLTRELNTIRRSHDVQERIAGITEAGFKANQVSQRQLVMERMNEILNEISYDSAYADLQNAYASLYSSMGLAYFDIDLNEDLDIDELAEKLEYQWTQRSLVLPTLGG